ncbi:larval cuticle protein 65Ag1-like [Drosophila albomicans]|uniref:Larval cuticle protein 65Ag1-like n=1 Tax=Drosophila albomicans TaxID=7291 RepID=A0A6P8WHG2_DROAB|nr:larval cuticle protein 65Ag1-like [Drosophila albomicans]
MKFLIVFVALFALVLAAPDAVEIHRQDSVVTADGYNFDTLTSDGSRHVSSGKLLPGEEEDKGEYSVKGSYSFVADDGLTYTVDYIADKNGFQPSGAHLPIAPEALH